MMLTDENNAMQCKSNLKLIIIYFMPKQQKERGECRSIHFSKETKAM
jgi:hypothetical protein